MQVLLFDSKIFHSTKIEDVLYDSSAYFHIRLFLSHLEEMFTMLL